jgi:hypothetical protein
VRCPHKQTSGLKRFVLPLPICVLASCSQSGRCVLQLKRQFTAQTEKVALFERVKLTALVSEVWETERQLAEMQNVMEMQE